MATVSKEKLVKQLKTQFPSAREGDIGMSRETSGAFLFEVQALTCGMK
jgi:hypothetical protein